MNFITFFVGMFIKSIFGLLQKKHPPLISEWWMSNESGF